MSALGDGKRATANREEKGGVGNRHRKKQPGILDSRGLYTAPSRGMPLDGAHWPGPLPGPLKNLHSSSNPKLLEQLGSGS